MTVDLYFSRVAPAIDIAFPITYTVLLSEDVHKTKWWLKAGTLMGLRTKMKNFYPELDWDEVEDKVRDWGWHEVSTQALDHHFYALSE